MTAGIAKNIFLAIVIGISVTAIWWGVTGETAEHRFWEGAVIARYCGGKPIWHLKDGSYRIRNIGKGDIVEDIEKVCK